MYSQIINELNHIIKCMNISDTLDPNMFQSILIKKLSNQNIPKHRRLIPAGYTISPVNQTHIDITGRKAMLFFFETIANNTTKTEKIDIDIYDNNFYYLLHNSLASRITLDNGDTIFKRLNSLSSSLPQSHKIIYSSAYKKYGHGGEQVQINMPNSKERFHHLYSHSFYEDALIVLRYNYHRYLALIIPVELCKHLYTITNTHGTHNVNYVINNPSYNSDYAIFLQTQKFFPEVHSEEEEIHRLRTLLSNNQMAGTDINRIIKSRVSQGDFRKLLLLKYEYKCCVCDISTIEVLRASHIKEWARSNSKERVDLYNGLLLCANHDALFDRHLISFDPDTGKIVISSTLSSEERNRLNLTESMQIDIPENMYNYMKWHYEQFKNNENL